jgi:hypothetical protein
LSRAFARSQGTQDADSSSTRRKPSCKRPVAVIANGYLRLDHAEWIRVVEKRSAALQDH